VVLAVVYMFVAERNIEPDYMLVLDLKHIPIK
jgi:hypothetical protein